MPQSYENSASPDRKLKFRLRVLRHFDEITHNVCATSRHFGTHRSQFYAVVKLDPVQSPLMTRMKAVP